MYEEGEEKIVQEFSYEKIVRAIKQMQILIRNNTDKKTLWEVQHNYMNVIDVDAIFEETHHQSKHRRK